MLYQKYIFLNYSFGPLRFITVLLVVSDGIPLKATFHFEWQSRDWRQRLEFLFHSSIIRLSLDLLLTRLLGICWRWGNLWMVFDNMIFQTITTDEGFLTMLTLKRFSIGMREKMLFPVARILYRHLFTANLARQQNFHIGIVKCFNVLSCRRISRTTSNLVIKQKGFARNENMADLHQTTQQKSTFS